MQNEKRVPTLIYELLPFLYFWIAVMLIMSLDSPLKYVPAITLFVATALIGNWRLSNRRS